MTENQSLLAWVGGIFGAALVLVGAVVAHDRLGIVDHLFDFHLDVGEIQQEMEKEREKREKEAAVQREWCRDLSFSDHELGTCTPPENNGNRD